MAGDPNLSKDNAPEYLEENLQYQNFFSAKYPEVVQKIESILKQEHTAIPYLV